MPRTVEVRTPFAHRLLRIRKARGLSQRDLSKVTGVSPRVIALYETTIKFPTADIVMRLAKALEVSIDQLMGRRPVKTSEVSNRGIIKKVKKIEELMPEDQKTILRMIDRFHNDTKRKP